MKVPGIKYPNIEVELIGHDGNAFAILGKVVKEMRRGGVSKPEISAYRIEAMNGNYDHLLQTTMRWVSVG